MSQDTDPRLLICYTADYLVCLIGLVLYWQTYEIWTAAHMPVLVQHRCVMLGLLQGDLCTSIWSWSLGYSMFPNESVMGWYVPWCLTWQISGILWCYVIVMIFLYTRLKHLFHFCFIIHMFTFDRFKNRCFTFTFHFRLNMCWSSFLHAFASFLYIHFYMLSPYGLLLYKPVEYGRRTSVCSLLGFQRILLGFSSEHWLDEETNS